MATTIKGLWLRYLAANMLIKIVVINAVVFVLLRIAVIVGIFSGYDDQGAVLSYVEMPSNLQMLAHRPWTVITYMFSQYEVMHVLFNMLWLYMFGYIFLSLSTPKQLMGLYLYGGLGGGVLYLLAYNMLPAFANHYGMLIGSSASVIAVVVATAVTVPDYKLNLMLLGSVSLKWIAIVTIGLDLISITGSNAGGHLAHIGGALIGVWYALAMRSGCDITRPLNSCIDSIVNLFKGAGAIRLKSPKRQSKPSNAAATSDRESLDAILDKIKKSGYSSLTAEERKKLFDVSSRIK